MMKKLKEFVFSMGMSISLLAIFGISIAYATFAESSSGTQYAKEIVYNATWFELLLLLLVINLTGSMFRYNLVNRKKWSVLLFHVAFIFMVAGAAITRFTGFESVMHLRQGETSNQISSDKSAVNISIAFNGETKNKSVLKSFSTSGDNSFLDQISIGSKTVTIENELFIPNAVETVEPDNNGEPAVSLFVRNSQNQSVEFVLFPGEINYIENLSFGFGNNSGSANLLFSVLNNELFFTSTVPIVKTQMMQKNEIPLEAGILTQVEARTIYRIENMVFVLKSFIPKARRTLAQATGNMEESNSNALIFKISDGINSKKINVFSDKNGQVKPAFCKLNELDIWVSYGSYQHTLPFSITLRKFQLDRYPGSNSPSSYASEITITDTEMKSVRPFRIYMNNILNYRGYRFFQSSYDQDEQGTILSVTHDYWGTFITYLGYFLMIAGMILTMLNKNSRFRTLLKLSNQLQLKRKATKITAMVLVLFCTISASASNNSKKEHLNALNNLLIQDNIQGRLEPLSTYSSDILRKISKQTSYRNQSAAEVFVGMCANAEKWQAEPLIKVANPQLANELGADNGYISFNNLFDATTGQYKLTEKVEHVYQKEQTQRNKYDKEIVNVDERANICSQLFAQKMISIFPAPQNDKEPWRVDETQKEMLANYLGAYNQAIMSGNWNAANEKLMVIKAYQITNGGDNLPSQKVTRIETTYNRLNIFGNLAILYIAMGFLLLVLHLINIFNFTVRLEKLLNYAVFPMLVIFLFYSSGLIMRWYISGHAPWSNGYETMLFVGWASSLAGLIFVRKSPITLAITAVLSAIALFVAGMSWMNPEITNLVPVLKSYWLIVHVAIITSSYGFLAMAALLGLLNLILMIFRTKSNTTHLSDNIQEISYIVELAMIIGLIMLTIGCFIGGIWANESWGRYWGWDPKETWALVSILVYTTVLHLRNVPKANNQFTLNSLALVSFGTIVMTFFGVNYYLSGMHSYAQGAPPPIPNVLYIAIVAIFSLIAFAFFAEKRNGSFGKS